MVATKFEVAQAVALVASAQRIVHCLLGFAASRLLLDVAWASSVQLVPKEQTVLEVVATETHLIQAASKETGLHSEVKKDHLTADWG